MPVLAGMRGARLSDSYCLGFTVIRFLALPLLLALLCFSVLLILQSRQRHYWFIEPQPIFLKPFFTTVEPRPRALYNIPHCGGNPCSDLEGIPSTLAESRGASVRSPVFIQAARDSTSGQSSNTLSLVTRISPSTLADAAINRSAGSRARRACPIADSQRSQTLQAVLRFNEALPNLQDRLPAIQCRQGFRLIPSCFQSSQNSGLMAVEEFAPRACRNGSQARVTRSCRHGRAQRRTWP